MERSLANGYHREYQQCIKFCDLIQAHFWCNALIERGTTPEPRRQTDETRRHQMATQLQQTMANVRRARVGNWLAGLASAALIAGAVAVGLAGAPSHTVRQAPAQPGVTVSYGIDLPTGARYEHLPQGLRDDIRSALPVFVPAPASNLALGIDTPQGADTAALPAGLTDYLHDRRGVGMHPANSTAAARTVLGIDLPAGADRTALPAGIRDYLRDQGVHAARQPARRSASTCPAERFAPIYLLYRVPRL
jgi:hypothetical protein